MPGERTELVFAIRGENIEVLDQAGNKLGEIATKAKDAEQATGSLGSGGAASLRAYAAEAGAAGIAAGAMAAGVALATAAVVASARENVRRVDELNNLSVATGLSVRQLSQLDYVARANQVSLSALGGGFVALNRSISEAANGAGRDARVFAALGVDVRQGLNGPLRDNVAILRDVADRFAVLPDGVVKSSAATALFAGNADVMLKVMRGGSTEIDRLIGSADRLGFTLDDKTTSSATRITDALNRTTAAAYGVGVSIGQPFLGPLAAGAEGMAFAAEKTNEFLRSLNPGPALLSGFGEAVRQQIPILYTFVELYSKLTRGPDFGGVTGGGSSTALDPASAALKRITDALGRPGKAGGSGGGGGGGGSAEANRLAQLTDQSVLGASQASVTNAQTAVTLAEQDLSVFRQRVELETVFAHTQSERLALLNASQQREFELAKRVDDATERELDAQIAVIEARKQDHDVVEAASRGLTGQLDALNAQEDSLRAQKDLVAGTAGEAAKVTQEYARGRAELEASKQASIDLGNTLNDSLQRAVDGLLAQDGGNFNVGNVLLGSARATTASLVGDFVKGIDFGSLFSGGGASSVSGGGLFSDVSGGSSSTAEAGGDSLGGLGGLGAAAASYGVTVALDLALNAQKRTKDLYNRTNLLRTTLDQGDIVYAAGGGGIVGGNGAAMARYEPMTRFFLDAFGFMQAPTGGTQRAMALEKILRSQGLPQQSVYGVGEGGIRAQFLTNAPNAASAAAFEAAGFGFDIPGLRQPTIEQLVTPGRNGATYAHSPNRVGEALRLIEEAGRERPGVEALRTNEALGLGLILTGGTRRGVNVANLLTNNLLLTGVSEGEARRQLKKIAESQGVTLSGGVEEAQRLYIEKRLRDDPKTLDRNEAKDQLFTAVDALVGLFKDDLPAGVDASAIALANFTEKAGIDIDAFNTQLERSVAIFGALESTEKAGLRTGLDTAIGSFAKRDQLLAGGGSISDIIKAGAEGRRGIVSSLYDAVSTGFTTAITDGLQDAIQDSPQWTALTERIAGAVNGAPLGDIPALIGDLVNASLPQIEAAAQAVALLRGQIGVSPTALFQTRDTLLTQVKDSRYGLLTPRQQEASLKGELATLDQKIAAIEAGGVTPDEAVALRPLLDRRAQIGFALAQNASQRYAPGSAQQRAAEYGFSIVEDTARLFADLGDSQKAQVDATDHNTSAVAANTAAINANTQALLSYGGGSGTPNMHRTIDAYFTSDKPSTAARNKIRSYAGVRG